MPWLSFRKTPTELSGEGWGGDRRAAPPLEGLVADPGTSTRTTTQALASDEDQASGARQPQERSAGDCVRLARTARDRAAGPEVQRQGQGAPGRGGGIGEAVGVGSRTPRMSTMTPWQPSGS